MRIHRTALSKRSWDSLSRATWGGGWAVCVLGEGVERSYPQINATSSPTPLALPLLSNGKDKGLCVCSSDKIRWKQWISNFGLPEISKVVQRCTNQQLPGPVRAREQACVCVPVNIPAHACMHLLKIVYVHSLWLSTALARSLGPQDTGKPASASLADPPPCVFPPINWE